MIDPKPTEEPCPELAASPGYALFCGHCYYPSGGAADFRAWGAIEDLKRLYADNADQWSIDASGAYSDPWGQIADAKTMEVILEVRGHREWVARFDAHNVRDHRSVTAGAQGATQHGSK